MARPNFDALRDMHNSANDLLHSPTIQRALLHQRQEKWVHEVSEASLRMLDVCGTSKDVLLLVNQQLQHLQFTLRRVCTGEPDIGSKIAACNRYGRKPKKETLKRLNSLKRVKNKKSSASDHLSPIDDNLKVVVDVLKEVRVTTISIVESLLSLISIPSWLDQKAAKGSFASRFIRVSGQGLYDICDVTAVQSANKRLEAVEIDSHRRP